MAVNEQKPAKAEQKLSVKAGQDEGSATPPYQAQSSATFTINCAGTLHAFAFWFSLGASSFPTGASASASPPPSSWLDTGPLSAGDGRHWRQAAVAVDPPRSVEVGDRLSVHISMGAGVCGGVDVRLLA